MCTGYYSLSLINVADSVALQFTLPIFTMFFAVLMLGEKIYSHRLIATVVGFAGVLIIVRPGFAEVNLGILFALAASAFHAVGDVYARYLARYDKIQTIMIFRKPGGWTDNWALGQSGHAWAIGTLKKGKRKPFSIRLSPIRVNSMPLK